MLEVTVATLDNPPNSSPGNWDTLPRADAALTHLVPHRLDCRAVLAVHPQLMLSASKLTRSTPQPPITRTCLGSCRATLVSYDSLTDQLGDVRFQLLERNATFIATRDAAILVNKKEPGF